MTLEILLRGSVNGIAEYVEINYEISELLWGIRYQKAPMSTTVPQSATKIELVYEGTKSRKLYLISTPSLEEIKPEAKIYVDGEDVRYWIFGSRELFKAFFEDLNEDLRRRLEITDDVYITILEKISRLVNEMYAELGNYPLLLRPFVKPFIVRHFRQILEQDSLILHYLYSANVNLTVKSGRLL